MRNKITGIIILISIVLLVFAAVNGIKIGSFQILSISELKEKNNALSKKIDEATTLTSINYVDNVKILEDTYDRYIIQKQKYEELVGVTSDIKEEIYETKRYDIGYLWRILGNYATKRNLNLGIDVKKNNVTNNSYDINFAVSGKYVNISQFITDIENDSDLYFRIYDFRMSGSEENISSTFTVRNINIDSSTITQTTVMENN